MHSNITATLTLLELSRLHGVKNFVYASSSSVYGRNAKVPFCETDSTDHPVSPYAATKKTCELLAHTYSHLYGLPCTGLRFFTVYGPRGRPDMAPFMFVDKISKGLPIKQFGDGTSSRDYTYIADIVQGVLAALDTPQPYEIYNLGNNKCVSLKDFIAMIESLLGRKAVVMLLPDQPGDVKTTYAHLGKSAAALKYKPKWSLQEGLQSLVEWYLKEHNASFLTPPSSPAKIMVK